MEKDSSMEGVLQLRTMTEPEVGMMVTLEGSESAYLIASQTEQDILDSRVRINPLGSGVERLSRVAIVDLRRIVVEYEEESVKPEYAMTGTAQIPLVSDQWAYVLKNRMIGRKVRFVELLQKVFPHLEGLRRREATLIIGKKLVTEDELYAMGEACYNFRIQQEKSKTDVSFREWFKSKFL